MTHHILLGVTLLCGLSPEGTRVVGWASRVKATCDRCLILAALADANRLNPWNCEPSLRQALDKIVRENSSDRESRTEEAKGERVG